MVVFPALVLPLWLVLPLDLRDLDKAFEDKDATENLEDDNGFL